MVSGYVLIVAVMLLGGIIATVGDRIGTRVGKARLSLFNLRPRQTATLVSIATGSVISASTLAILFGISSQLRTGVFELSQIQADLEATQAELEQAEQEQTQVADELTAATRERERARTRLREINQSLQAAQQRQQTTQAQLGTTQAQLSQTRDQLASISQQTTGLRAEINRLQQERSNLQRQQQAIRGQIAERDQEIAERDAAIAQREQLLVRLETQQQFLSQQINALERQYEGLFRGNIALGRNQELVSSVIRVDNPEDATQIITRLIYEANRRVVQRIAPGPGEERQVVLIETKAVEDLVKRLSDGQEYVIQVFSAANYIIGEPCVVSGQEPCVQIFINATPNELVYDTGERLAITTLDNTQLSDRQLVEQLNLLIAATQFRAKQEGIIGTIVQISDNRTETLLAFLEQVKDYEGPIELMAIAATPIFTTGPIQIELVAVKDGALLFETRPELPPSGASSQN